MSNIISLIQPNTNKYAIRSGYTYYGITTGTASQLTVTITDETGNTIEIPELTKGLTLILQLHIIPTDSATLAVNSLTAKTIQYGNGVGGANWELNNTYVFVYNGTAFVAISTYDDYVIKTTGSGNAITKIEKSGKTITATKGATYLTAHPTITKSTDTTSTQSVAHQGSFTVIDSVTRDGNGHVTKVNTKTVTLPSDVGEVNQNAFSNIKIGENTIEADSKTDTLTLVAGTNITLTPDTTNDKITIAATDTVYTHPATHAASMITGLATVATSGKYSDLSDTPTSLKNPYTLTIQGNGTNIATYNGSAAVTANIPAASTSDYGVTKLSSSTSSSSEALAATPKAVKAAYDLANGKASTATATTTANGLMSSTDKTKLDGIASGAEVNVQSDWNETTTTSDAYIKNKPSLATVATSGKYSDLSNKPSSLKNPNSLTVGSKSYDGSAAITITAQDLGLDSALKYCGVTTTNLSDGATTNPIVINSKEHTATTGCVVFYDSKEFVYDGTKWTELGDGSNHKIKQDAVSSPSASGSTTAFIDTISQDANGKITASKKNVKFPTIPTSFTISATATDDDVVVLTGSGGANSTTYDAKHAEKGPASGYTSGNTTTSISGSGGSGTIKIPQITVDKYGHVTAAADESVTITLPTLPSVGNGTVTINQAGAKVGSFTMNQSGNTTIDLTDNNTWRPISDSVSTTNSATSASLTAVKTAYDKAVSAYDLANGKTSNTGTVTSITPGTGLTGTNSDTAITTSGTINLKAATSSEIGGISIGYTQSDKNYPVQLDTNNKAYVNVPWTDNNTKNTAGSTDTSKKIFLIGAESQAANPQTYSHDTAYVGTDGCLYSKNTKVSVDGHTHDYAGSSSAGGAATSAVKLETERSIAISGGATGTATNFDGTANISIPVTGVSEAYLTWGGKNHTGSYGPIDAAMISELGANRLAFTPANNITVEYSQNGGSTWSTYSTSNSVKIGLFSTNEGNYIIGADSTKNKDKTNYMLRVTINTSNTIYTSLNKFMIYCSTNGSTGSYCTILARLQSNVESNTETWKTVANQISLSGWSGYNIINTSSITTYGNNKTSQYGQLRFVFGVTSHPSTVDHPGLSIWGINGFGGVGWTCPSTMAKTGHLYSYDASKNATFPGDISLSNSSDITPKLRFIRKTKTDDYYDYFLYGKTNGSSSNLVFGYSKNGTDTDVSTFDVNGNYSGNAATATTASKLGTATKGSATQPIYLASGVPTACTYTLEANVPSTAVFTDTHYTSKNVVGASDKATKNAAATNSNVYLNHLEESTVKSSHKITGSGATTVTSDANGNITISSTDTDTVYTHPATHAASMITGLATVATSGKYSDLSGTPTSLKNPNSLTIQGNGTDIATYDGSSAVTANIPAASTRDYGVTKLSSSTSSSSEVLAATPKAVKAAYDLANGKTSNTGTVTSITPGIGLTGTSSDTAITTSGTINLKAATSSEIGGISIGYTQSDKNYPVQLDTNNKAYVNVPWTDTNTNTHYTSKNVVGASAEATNNAKAEDNKVYLNHIEEDTITSSHYIKGDGSTTVKSDDNGNITISSTNTTYSSKTAASGDNAVSLVTRNEKYIWNNKIGPLSWAVNDTNWDLSASDRKYHVINATSTLVTITISSDTCTGIEHYLLVRNDAGSDINIEFGSTKQFYITSKSVSLKANCAIEFSGIYVEELGASVITTGSILNKGN